MAFKIKQEKTAPEIEHARGKLEEELQNIINKADDSPSSSEDEYHKSLNDISIKKEPLPLSTPAKRPAQRTQRKRRRRDETMNKSANSYIMKLFDRAVDVTPFTEQSPLYPICRAWINNQSLYKHLRIIKEEPIEEPPKCDNLEQAEENSDDIHQLPPPIPLMVKDLRIPSPIPQPKEEFVICSDENNVNTRDSLMANHLQRWKAVRRKWKQAARINEERYSESGDILRTIFERAQGHDETSSNDQWDGMTPVT